MAYDEQLAERVRAAVGARADLDEKKMFGGLAFLVGGHMAVAVSGAGGLMIRLHPDDFTGALAEPGAQPFEMNGRTMKAWLRVDADVLDDDAVLAEWVERSVGFAATLPPK